MKSNMKRIISVILGVVLIFSLTACRENVETEKTSQSQTKETVTEESAGGKIKIGVSLPSPANQFVGAIVENVQTEAAIDSDKYDVKVVVSDDPNAQVSAIEDLMLEELDVLLVLPLDSAPVTPICEKAYDEGIKVVILDRGIESDKYTTFIEGDNYGIGVSAANYIGEKLNGVGKVVEIIGVPCEIVTRRSKGFYDTIKEKYPNIEVVATGQGDFAREPAMVAMEDILQAQDHIDAIYSHDDEQSIGIDTAVKNAGREKEMFCTGCGGNKSVFEGMINDDTIVTATFLYSPTMGATALRVAKAIAAGESLEKASENDEWLKQTLITEYGDDFLTKLDGNVPNKITLTAATVTKENVDSYYNPDSNY